jgi:hypothetical protein
VAQQHGEETPTRQREKEMVDESEGHQVNRLAHQRERVQGGGRQPNGRCFSPTQGKPTCARSRESLILFAKLCNKIFHRF